MKQPFLCRLGFHKEYRYLPRVPGDLAEISIACRRCGYGYRYFAKTWDIAPGEVQESISNEASIAFGKILMELRGLSDPKRQLQIGLLILRKLGQFSDKELEPLEREYSPGE